MRTYKVSEMEGGCCAVRVRKALHEHFGEDISTEVNVIAGEVPVESSAEPQVVSFLLDGAGFPVVSVED